MAINKGMYTSIINKTKIIKYCTKYTKYPNTGENGWEAHFFLRPLIFYE